MNDANRAVVERFYHAFVQRDAEAMVACYSDDIVFSDPIFGTLRGLDAGDMWRMLVSRAEQLEVSVDDVRACGDSASAHWRASYRFGPRARRVVNDVQARFQLRDGLICRHEDSFALWSWSRQALGLPGLLLGWSPLLQGKVRRQAFQGLRSYQQRRG
ncbi:nuclear transport factor 2 family protein [Pseudomonas cremoricolorata]|uniref:nuclear transport factor 2 family protein n=1 Tax=Pseudomonas cremoricolorata TaxID=157783 RepID=UPI0003FFD51C|nr:nuclear transport factor 2 family protein [Pseudomonas cremoricolorata]